MKKLLFLLFILLLPVMVEAKAFKCSYKTDFFNPDAGEVELVLTTNTNGTKLVSGNASNGIEIEFDGDGIAVSGGKCPSVSIYMRKLNSHYKIFKNKSACKKSTTNTSTSDDTDSNIQFVLKGSESNSCTFENNKYGKIKINYSKGKISSTCTSSAMVCKVVAKNKEIFLEDDKFSCPKAIYVSAKPDTHGNTVIYEYQIVEGASEDDEIRGEVYGAYDGNWDPETLCGANNENCNVDITAFCLNPYVSRTLKFLGMLLVIAKVLVPAIIIVMGFIDLWKIVIAGKSDVVRKQLLTIFRRIVLGIIIFLIPSFMITVYNVGYNIANDLNEENITDNLLVPENFKNCVGCILDATNGNSCIVDLSKLNE